MRLTQGIRSDCHPIGQHDEGHGGNDTRCAISHLPQMPPRRNTHYFVYKDNFSSKTITHIRKLDESERMQKIRQDDPAAQGHLPCVGKRQGAMEGKSISKARNNAKMRAFYFFLA